MSIAGPAEVPEPLDPLDVRLARTAPGLLRAFNDAGVLAAADVHVARRLAALTGETGEGVVLAVALAVRAPRLGHVFADLATIRETAAVDTEDPVDLAALPWPEPAAWAAAVAASPLAQDGPLVLEGSRLYLDRYWREERAVAADLLALAAAPPEDVDTGLLARLGGDGEQRAAVAAAAGRHLAVIAGGPGTGKTTTVARIVALLQAQAAARGAAPPLIALAAPTGKAAARLQEAVHAEGVDPELEASTLHRLLGWRPGSHSRFRHHRGNRLPHDVVIVDETSMVSLTLMARLAEAVRPDARLVLVGDPGQLTSIEAGAVLGDVVGPAADGGTVTGPLAPGTVVLERVHRYGEGIARLATAIRRGDGDGAMAVLRDAPDGVRWLEADAADAPEPLLAPVRDEAVGAGRAVVAAARAGDARGAIDRLGAFRLLCAHRRGPHGVATWGPRVEAWLAAAVDGYAAEGRWYAGRPLLVTENDYGLRLYNGDAGVVIADDAGGLRAAFERGRELVTFRPARLGAVETVNAMTVHKSQGSQFGTAAVLLPPPGSPLLTRELLYTAVTRARERLVLVATEDAVRAAVARPVARASGLRDRLWP